MAKFVSLDSSMLGDLARDYFSEKEIRRSRVRHFIDRLSEGGVIPFLCWHQFEELIKHGNDKVAAERFAFLKALPLAAWVPTHDGSTLGSVVDLFVAECSAILELGQQCSIYEVRDMARRELIAFGSGAEAVEPYEDHWFELRPHLWKRERRAREIVALTRAKVVDISEQTLGSYLNGSVRPPDQVQRVLSELQMRMVGEIRQRGDRRIPNPDEVAADFYAEVAAEGSHLLVDETASPSYALTKYGIDLNQLDPNTRMGKVLEIVEFRSKLEVAHRAFNMSLEAFRNAILPELVPTWLVEKSITNYGQLRGEHKGSELNDRHLACLAPYCHLTYVDRQTNEDVRRSKKKSSDLEAIIGNIERVTTYEKALNRIEKGDF